MEKAVEAERIDVGFMFAEIEGPHGITVDPSGDFGIYLWLMEIHLEPWLNTQLETNQAVARTTLGLFPASMEISNITGFLYCVNFNLHGSMKPSNVSVVDPETMTEITKITTGSMPHGSRLSPDGLFQVFCCNDVR